MKLLNIPENLQIGVCIFVMCILLFLTGFMIRDARGYDCNKCVISYKSQIMGGNMGYSSINLSSEKIYNSLLNKACVLTWSKTEGFKLNE